MPSDQAPTPTPPPHPYPQSRPHRLMQVLGSLSLLFNPTGLVQSVRAGVADLIGLPLAALQNQSLAQFISGVGQGSVSLVKHTLGEGAAARGAGAGVRRCVACADSAAAGLPAWPGPPEVAPKPPWLGAGLFFAPRLILLAGWHLFCPLHHRLDPHKHQRVQPSLLEGR